MKVNTVDNQNFNGKFIIKNKLSGRQKKVLNWLMRWEEDSLWFKPYDMYVKSTKSGGMAFSVNEKFKTGYIARKYDYYEDYRLMYQKTCRDAQSAIRKDNIGNRILYALRLKKYTG